MSKFDKVVSCFATNQNVFTVLKLYKQFMRNCHKFNDLFFLLRIIILHNTIYKILFLHYLTVEFSDSDLLLMFTNVILIDNSIKCFSIKIKHNY